MVKLKKIDLELETAGVRVDHPSGFHAVLRPLDAPAVRDAQTLELTTASASKGGKPLLESEHRAASMRGYAKAGLVSWGNIDEEPVVCEAAALRLMTLPELRHFQMWVLGSAAQIECYLSDEEVGHVLGN